MNFVYKQNFFAFIKNKFKILGDMAGDLNFYCKIIYNYLNKLFSKTCYF